MQKDLGQYRILERLGSGAMGEVYVAQDTKLGRKVAIKMLPPEVADSPERREQLEREAQIVASLNHPNIVTVHSVEEAEGSHFITMELVEGTTLTSLLPAMTQKRFFELAIPLADAMGTAHRHGMVHRDLKPENIMVNEEGRPKVLDFGLAKLTHGLGGNSISELETRAKTEEGLIVGTIAYMSPEQAEGKTIDERADIFALGIIFYEMLAKRHPFPGESAAAILSSILRATAPSLDEVDSQIPYELARIVRRCLEKEPATRYQNAIDLRNDLEEVQRDIASGALATRAGVPAEPRWKKLVPWGVVAVAAANALIPRGGDVPEPPVRRHVFQPPSSTPIRGRPWLSPDGSHLFFSGGRDGERGLYVRALDELTSRLVPGTERAAAHVSLSPDGEWLVFQSRGTVRKVPVNGGEPIILCDVWGYTGGDWGDDDNVVFGAVNKGLSRVSAEGGQAEELFEPKTEAGELDVHDPHVLPGSQAALYTLHTRDGSARVEAYIFETGERRVLVEDAFSPRYAPTGHIIYGTAASTLFAAPFDLARLEITGPSVRVLENVRTEVNNARTRFSIASDGTLAYAPELSLDGRALIWVDGRGNEEPLDVEPRAFSDPRLSPDGTQMAVAIRDGETQDIWVYDLEINTRQRITLEGVNEAPVWTLDGQRITFTSDRDGGRNLFWKRADGSGAAERLYASDLRQWPRAWTPDGRSLVFDESTPTDVTQIRVLHPGREPLVEPFAQGRFNQIWARFSRDGRWLAYTDDYEVFVRPHPGLGGARQISTEGGEKPIWSWDGTLFYRRGDQVIAVSMETRIEQVLFEGAYVTELFHSSYDVAPDGRFLMIKPSEDELAERTYVIVENWFSELRRRVPTP